MTSPFSSRLPTICKKFTQHPLEIYVDDDSKLALHGLQQFYVKLEEAQKNRKLNDLLDALEFKVDCSNFLASFVNRWISLQSKDPGLIRGSLLSVVILCDFDFEARLNLLQDDGVFLRGHEGDTETLGSETTRTPDLEQLVQLAAATRAVDEESGPPPPPPTWRSDAS
jgi:hypothetical protein